MDESDVLRHENEYPPPLPPHEYFTFPHSEALRPNDGRPGQGIKGFL